jgi:hypothetical protein
VARRQVGNEGRAAKSHGVAVVKNLVDGMLFPSRLDGA